MKKSIAKVCLNQADLGGKQVLLRVDFNTPVSSIKSRVIIENDYRIKMALPTIKELLEQRCSIIIIAHLGRPDGRSVRKFSLKPVAQRLADLLGEEVAFMNASSGKKVDQAAKELKSGEILMLENLRFDKREKADDTKFAKELAGLADVFVQDAFGVLHRKHASVSGVPKYLPSYLGLLVQREYEILTDVLEKPKKPVAAIIGGSKIVSKIDLIDNLMDHVKTIVVAGAMANTFLRAEGVKIGKSVYEKNELTEAKKIMHDAKKAKVNLVLPKGDVGVARAIDENERRRDVKVDEVDHNDIILDFGPASIKQSISALKSAKTIIWNGPIGMMELDKFIQGSQEMAEFLAKSSKTVVVGGGDTAALVHRLGLHDEFFHVSTGGGASLELLSGNKLPGIEAIK